MADLAGDPGGRRRSGLGHHGGDGAMLGALRSARNRSGKRLQPPSARIGSAPMRSAATCSPAPCTARRIPLPIAVIVVRRRRRHRLALGAIAGFFGGLADAAIMRAVDITLSFPPMLLAMAVTASLGPGLRNAGHRHGARLVAGLCPADAGAGAGGQGPREHVEAPSPAGRAGRASCSRISCRSAGRRC